MATLLERLEKYSVPFDNCIVWSGYRNSDGYGTMRLRPADSPTGARIMTGAHRVALFVYTGVWAEEVCHTCDNPACIKEGHLYAGTHTTNMRDRLERGNHPMASKTHCSNGHPLSGDNLGYAKPNLSHPNGQRFCRTCSRAAIRRSYYKSKFGGQ